MKITGYDLFTLPPRWIFLRIETSEGIVGWGELTLGGRQQAVCKLASRMLENYLIGKDPLETERIWQLLYRTGFDRGGPIQMTAIAGIDQALWDIKGKHADMPVYQLLGGKARDRVRIYQMINGQNAEELGKAANKLVNNGVKALKINPTTDFHSAERKELIQNTVELISKVDSVVDDEVKIGIDLHGRADKATSKRLVNLLEPYDPMFIEEPVSPEYANYYTNIARNTSIPVATGERLYSRWDFRDLFETHALDIIQPDPSHAGGISETTKIAHVAAMYDVGVAPDQTNGPISLASCIQIDASIQPFSIQEVGFDVTQFEESRFSEYLENPSIFSIENGFIEIPDGPGLGIQIDEDTVREFASVNHVDWSTPIMTDADGSVGEW